MSIDGEENPLCLRWTGNVTRVEAESRTVQLSISARNGERQFALTNVRTVKDLSLPFQTVDDNLIKSQSHLADLPIQRYDMAQPKLLIGLNNCKLGVSQKVRYSRESGLVCTQTVFGWIVHGITNVQSHHIISEPSLNVHQCDCDLHYLVKQHFTLENMGITSTKNNLPSLDEERALDILCKYSRRINGRFETALLWAADNIILPNNYDMAVRRHLSLERKLIKNPGLFDNMKTQIQEYLTNNYIRILPKAEVSRQHPRLWYLPIFPVVNANKPGKVRIVWDAAASYKNVSLNSKLLKGPDQLTSLVGVLYRFREHSIAIAADIKQMFHQIRVREEDRISQRFLWRNSPNEDLQIMEMMVMTFGASCSPCCAQFIKNKNAEEFRSEFSEAADAIIFNHYVDDYLDSSSDESKAIQLAKDVRMIHQKGGFELRNWVSNSQYFLDSLNQDNSSAIKNLSILPGSSDKVLGMRWSTQDDCFFFELKINEKKS